MKGGPARWCCGAAAGLLLVLWAAGAAAAEERARRCVAGLFCIETLASARGLELWLESLGVLDLTVALELVLLGADSARHRRVLTIGEAAQERVFALTTDAPPLFRWSFSFHPGHRSATHDEAAVYRLPYSAGESYEVIQGPGGGFSHRGRDRHAIDWDLPAGTLVTAARGGRVIGLYQDAEAGGTDSEDLGRDNFVWIAHDDGTVGWYAHFQKGSLLVCVGERVSAGTPLGRAGASGYASGPHLHFHVSTPSAGPEAYETLPLRFDLGADGIGTPREGSSYRAP